jgi:hypothetical protein
MASAIKSDSPRSNERLTEIAAILADGLQRLPARQSSDKSANFEESLLHLSPDQSGDADPIGSGNQFAEVIAGTSADL